MSFITLYLNSLNTTRVIAFLRFVYHFNIFLYTILSHHISVNSSNLGKRPFKITNEVVSFI